METVHSLSETGMCSMCVLRRVLAVTVTAWCLVPVHAQEAATLSRQAVEAFLRSADLSDVLSMRSTMVS